MSIKYDDVEILTTDYIPQFMKHESAPERTLTSVPLAREDGEVLISTRYGKKIIRLQGTLRAASQSALDTAIDDFKELFSRQDKNLDITWAGGTRRYVATCSKHEFDRDYYHISAVPWTAEFTVASGTGYDTATTLAIDADEITTAETDSDGNFIYEGSFDIEGGKAAAPTITLEFTSADSAMLGIEFTNTDTGERIIITRNGDWNGATVIIDCFNKRVLDNVLFAGDPIEGRFSGLFPRFFVGTNNFRIKTGGIVNQLSSETSIPADGDAGAFFRIGTAVDDHFAVSLSVPYSDDTFAAVVAGLAREDATRPPTTSTSAYGRTMGGCQTSQATR